MARCAHVATTWLGSIVWVDNPTHKAGEAQVGCFVAREGLVAQQLVPLVKRKTTGKGMKRIKVWPIARGHQ
jgi:hypothetical protein